MCYHDAGFKSLLYSIYHIEYSKCCLTSVHVTCWSSGSSIHVVLSSGNALHVGSKFCLYESFTALDFCLLGPSCLLGPQMYICIQTYILMYIFSNIYSNTSPNKYKFKYIYSNIFSCSNSCLLIDWCSCRHAEQDEPHTPAAVAKQAGPAALPGEAQDEGD